MRLSIVIPVRGKPAELWFTLHSLVIHNNLDQCPDVEVIVADNEPMPRRQGKPTAHQDLVAKLGLGDRARYVAASEVKSPYHPRNVGAAKARGEWLLFLDSHVLMEIGFLEHLRRAVTGYDPTTIYHYPVTFHYPRRRYGHYDLESVMRTTFWGQWKNLVKATREPYPIGATGIWAYAIRKDFWNHIGGFNHRFQGYSGGEPYLDLKAWNLGNGVMLDPLRGGAHWSGPRDYVANYRDRVRNFALAVSVVAPEFLDSLRAHYEQALPSHRTDVPLWVDEGVALGEAEASWFARERKFPSHTDLVERWKETGVSF